MSPPFLRACPKYASKSYSSCASHILSFCFISVPSFIEISLMVFKLLSGHEIVWKIIKGKYLHVSKTSLDEPLDVHLCSYIHEQHRVMQRHT